MTDARTDRAAACAIRCIAGYALRAPHDRGAAPAVCALPSRWARASCGCGVRPAVSVTIEGAEHLDAALAKAPSLVPCYWHQHQLFCAKYLLEQRARGLPWAGSSAPRSMGSSARCWCARVGGRVIRGSSTHTGARALRDYYQALVQDNVSPVITPGRPARAALQVQARRDPARADVRTADAADGLCRLARLADQMGQVRDSGARLRASPSPSGRRVTCRASSTLRSSSSCSVEMEAELKRLYELARAAPAAADAGAVLDADPARKFCSMTNSALACFPRRVCENPA